MELVPIVIDLTYLYSLTEGDKAFEQMLLKCTIADIDTKIDGLRFSLATNQVKDIQGYAHSLISLSAIAGVLQVQDWSRTIDQKMVDGVLHPELKVLVKNIILAWPTAKIELKKNLKNTKELQL